MSKTQTVRELLSPRWPLVPDDVVRRDVWREAWDELHQSGILDAPVYGLCETCGGPGYTEGHTPDGKSHWQTPCPDCTGTVSVVTKELRERAARLFCGFDDCSDQNDEQRSELCPDWCKALTLRRADAVLSTVLGKTEEAAHAVVTPQGLEDAAQAHYEAVVTKQTTPWGCLSREGKDIWGAGIRKAIEAAGIEVVDEVVTVGDDAPGDFQGWPVFRDKDGLLTGCGIDPGDTIFIKRAVTDYCDKEEFAEGELPPADPPDPECLGWPDVTTGDNDEGL